MKITILGAAGNIGQILALLLKNNLPSNTNLALYDLSEIILGIAKDLSHIPTNIKITGYSKTELNLAIHNSDVIVISAGISRKPGMNREDLINVNAKIIATLIEKIAITAPEALICIITNPINIIVPLAAKILKKFQVYDKNKLFGITTLDVIRANTFVSNLKNIDPKKIDIKVIGGHSDLTILPLISQIPNLKFTKEENEQIIYLTQQAGTEVVNAKLGSGSATLSMGHAASRFTLSLVHALNGEENIIECAYVENQEKNNIKFLAIPVLLGKNGIEKRLDVNSITNKLEKEKLNKIIKIIKKDINLAEIIFEKYFK